MVGWVDRVTHGDIVGYRRSLAMSPTLTRRETERLLTELEQLLVERDRTIESLERLAPAFGEVRSVLNELHRTMRS